MRTTIGTTIGTTMQITLPFIRVVCESEQYINIKLNNQ